MQGFTPEDALRHGKQFPKKSAFSAPLMKIPISAKIPRPYGPPPLQKGAIGDFSALVPTTAAHFHVRCCTDWHMNYPMVKMLVS
jgi:hypothetical protein